MGSKSLSSPKVTQDKDVFGFHAPKMVQNHSVSGSSWSFAPHMSSVLGAGPCPSFLWCLAFACVFFCWCFSSFYHRDSPHLIDKVNVFVTFFQRAKKLPGISRWLSRKKIWTFKGTPQMPPFKAIRPYLKRQSQSSPWLNFSMFFKNLHPTEMCEYTFT